MANRKNYRKFTSFTKPLYTWLMLRTINLPVARTETEKVFHGLSDRT